MQVRKIDCKLTRQRNQSSSPEKRLISLQFFISYFLRCGNSNKKKLESGNQDNSNNMSREPLRFCVPLLLHLRTPNCQVQDRHFVYSFPVAVLYSARRRRRPRRLTRALVCMPICVCTCKRGPVCHVALMSFEAVPIPQSAVSRPSPTSSTRPREVVALVCIRSCVLQWFVKTL